MRMRASTSLVRIITTTLGHPGVRTGTLLLLLLLLLSAISILLLPSLGDCGLNAFRGVLGILSVDPSCIPAMVVCKTKELKVGDEIEVKVLRVDTDERKIGLSLKRVDWGEEEEKAAAAAEAAESGVPAQEGDLKGGLGSGEGPLFSTGGGEAKAEEAKADETEDDSEKGEGDEEEKEE